MRQSTTFATLFRQERTRVGKTMGDVARHLGISITYLSDVERGTRPPLSPERIHKAAAFLGMPEPNVAALIRAAQAQSEAISLPVPSSELGREAGVALQRGWSSFDDETFAQIVSLLHSRKGQ